MGNNSQQNKSQSASRTDYCGQLEASDVGREVVLKGWVQRVRDLGSLVFIDLRDRTGLVQLVARNSQPELLDEAKKLRCEYVVEARGLVNRREPAAINRQMATGEIEVEISGLKVLNSSAVPPFVIADPPQAAEELRLK